MAGSPPDVSDSTRAVLRGRFIRIAGSEVKLVFAKWQADGQLEAALPLHAGLQDDQDQAVQVRSNFEPPDTSEQLDTQMRRMRSGV